MSKQMRKVEKKDDNNKDFCLPAMNFSAIFFA